MTSDRSIAYGRVMKTLADMGPAKLQPAEQEIVREAADAMFFADDLDGNVSAAEALSRLGRLAAQLVEANRWLFDTADRLVHDVEACGPGRLQAVAPAPRPPSLVY
jgi:hypothetical protein